MSVGVVPDPHLRLPSAVMSRAAVFLGVALAFALGGCHHHLRLESPGAQAAQQYVCVDAPEGTPECRPADVIDPGALNPSGSTTINLPVECAGLIQSIVVLNADSDHPDVHVTCGAAVDPIDDTTSEQPE